MTAADARDALEAAIWRTRRVYHEDVTAILAAADAYAELVADERIAGRVSDRLNALERRAAADAEMHAHYGKAS